MPRRSPSGSGGLVFHVFNRAVRNTALFEHPTDYRAFEGVLKEAGERFKMPLLAYAVMRTHWHLVVWPTRDGDLSCYLHWLTMTHARRWIAFRGDPGRGAVYQGRFKAVPVQHDRHFFIVVRYVERNPVRRRLVTHAEDWAWSSASQERSPDQPTLHAWPLPKPHGWLDLLTKQDSDRAVAMIRSCTTRGVPIGTRPWRTAMVNRLALKPKPGPGGRPSVFQPEPHD